MSNPIIKINDDLIAAMTPKELFNNKDVCELFIRRYSVAQRVSEAQARDYLTQCAVDFLAECAKYTRCDAVSVKNAFLECAAKGLSVNPNKNEAYLLGFKNQKTGAQTLTLSPSYVGYMKMAHHFGFVSSITNPIIVYEGDKLAFFVNGKDRGVKYESSYLGNDPKKAVLGTFVCFTRTDGSQDYYFLSEAEYQKLSTAAKEKAARFNSSENFYSKHPDAMRKAKCIKKALSLCRFNLMEYVKDKDITDSILSDDTETYSDDMDYAQMADEASEFNDF